jgi:hypothetical protein
MSVHSPQGTTEDSHGREPVGEARRLWNEAPPGAIERLMGAFQSPRQGSVALGRLLPTGRPP